MQVIRFGVIGGSQGMGSWLVGFLRECGYPVCFSSLDSASEAASNQELVAQSDVIVLSVPISAFEEVMDEIFPLLNGKSLMEVCSVKKFVIDRFHSLQKQYPSVECRFYSFHPMFSNRISSLTGQVLLLTYTWEADFAFIEQFKHHFTQQKAVWHHVDYLYHDKVMGVVQGLNHFNVFVSARTLQATGISLDTVKEFSSPAYRIFLVFFTRYVLQNPRLYADIQLYNAFVPQVLRLFRQEVDKLLGLIEGKDQQGFIAYVLEMQPYFEENRQDEALSTHLIERLGKFLKKEG
jgi:prephenate dehydrogenase